MVNAPPLWQTSLVIAAIALCLVLITGCAQMDEILDPYFAEPYINLLENPTLTDIHLQSNRHYLGKEDSCLPNAYHKASYMRRYGFNPQLMAIQKHDSTSPGAHAFVVVDGMVYDNGYMSEVPFPVADLGHYGQIIPWQARWGREQ